MRFWSQDTQVRARFEPKIHELFSQVHGDSDGMAEYKPYLTLLYYSSFIFFSIIPILPLPTGFFMPATSGSLSLEGTLVVRWGMSPQT